MADTSTTAPMEPLLVTAQQITGGILPVSLANWRRADAAGRIPRGWMVLGRKVWRVDHLKRWVELGCPSRREFEAAGGGE